MVKRRSTSWGELCFAYIAFLEDQAYAVPVIHNDLSQ